MSGILQTMFGGKRTVTQTYTANTTWTAPAGVTSIKTLTGKGASGAPAEQSWTSTSLYIAEYERYGAGEGAGGSQPTFTFADAYSAAVALRDAIHAAAPGASVNYNYRGAHAVYTDNTLSAFRAAEARAYTKSTTDANANSHTYIYTTISGYYGVESTAPNNGSITNVALQSQDPATRKFVHKVVAPVDYIIPATTGSASTGFGKTFAGGTGGAATPATYNNVAVTPGSNYSLTIPSGGSITITYEA